MPYTLNVPENSVGGEDKYVDKDGKAECVMFVQQATNMSGLTTKNWQPSLRVMDAGPSQILRGTAIATFDENGKYPTDHNGKHAAIYLRHDTVGITVLDQWATKGKKGKSHEVPGVSERIIYFNKSIKSKRSDRAETFYVITSKSDPNPDMYSK
jgi:hypothetical protein